MQSYTLYIYKSDKRCKTGERVVSTTVWNRPDADSMAREVAELTDLYNPNQGYKFVYFPVIKNTK